MFIQTERTPNPVTLKFLPGQTVMDMGTANFPDVGSAERSPLAKALFEIGHVAGVFFGADFVTVTKDGEAPDWQELKPQILSTLMQHFTSGVALLDSDEADVPVLAEGDDPADAEIIVQIRELIDSKVRPAVARDGGDILYHGFREGIVYLHMQGSCAGCPSSTMTLKSGIENLLKHYVPEVVEVRSI